MQGLWQHLPDGMHQLPRQGPHIAEQDTQGADTGRRGRRPDRTHAGTGRKRHSPHQHPGRGRISPSANIVTQFLFTSNPVNQAISVDPLGVRIPKVLLYHLTTYIFWVWRFVHLTSNLKAMQSTLNSFLPQCLHLFIHTAVLDFFKGSTKFCEL